MERKKLGSQSSILVYEDLFPLVQMQIFFPCNRYGGWSFGLPLTADLRFDITAVPANRTLAKVSYDLAAQGYATEGMR